jgi:hypothetical protein
VLELCGLTFELKPTTEVGGVSLVRDDARVPRTRLTLPAVVGRRFERGVRPHLGSVEVVHGFDAATCLPGRRRHLDLV